MRCGAQFGRLRYHGIPACEGRCERGAPRITGAFHSAMPRTTPTGCRSAIATQPGLSDGITCPSICVVMAAASRSMPAASIVLSPAPGCGAYLGTHARQGYTPSADRQPSATRNVDDLDRSQPMSGKREPRSHPPRSPRQLAWRPCRWRSFAVRTSDHQMQADVVPRRYYCSHTQSKMKSAGV
jgi:hypothetical protein